MKRVYILRHGESESNVIKGIYKGQDAHLTEKGRGDINNILKFVEDLKIDKLVSSSYVRAIQTSQIIAKSINREIEVSNFFVEWEHPSDILGLTHEDNKFKTVKQNVKKLFLENRSFSDEESFSDLCNRAEKAKLYLEKIQDENILVVGHGKFTKFFLIYLCFGNSLNPETFLKIDDFFKSSTLGLSKIIFNDERWILKQWNAALNRTP